MKTARVAAPLLLLPLLQLISEASANIFSDNAGVTFNRHRRNYALESLKKHICEVDPSEASGVQDERYLEQAYLSTVAAE